MMVIIVSDVVVQLVIDFSAALVYGVYMLVYAKADCRVSKESAGADVPTKRRF